MAASITSTPRLFPAPASSPEAAQRARRGTGGRPRNRPTEARPYNRTTVLLRDEDERRLDALLLDMSDELGPREGTGEILRRGIAALYEQRGLVTTTPEAQPTAE